MVKSNSQMFVIGGTYPAGDVESDAAYTIWGQHNLWTGEINNEGDNVNDSYWYGYDASASTNVVPDDIYNVIGGDKMGGATLLSPQSGYDFGNDILRTLLTRTAVFSRTPTRSIPTATGSSTPPPLPHHRSLSTGAIVGIVIGSAVGFALISTVWFLISKRVYRNRQRRRSATPGPAYSVANKPESSMSPGMSHMSWPGSVATYCEAPPPLEMDAQNPPVAELCAQQPM
jgi:hypothetical protein